LTTEFEVILHNAHGVLTGLAYGLCFFRRTGELDLVVNPSVELNVETALLEQPVHF